MLKLSAQPEKIETGGTQLRRGRQFQFFPVKADSFNILAKSWFHETGRKNQPFKKMTFLLSVSVKLVTYIKKRNQFPYFNRPVSLRKKNETDGRGEAACRQFHFSS